MDNMDIIDKRDEVDSAVGTQFRKIERNKNSNDTGNFEMVISNNLRVREDESRRLQRGRDYCRPAAKRQ